MSQCKEITPRELWKCLARFRSAQETAERLLGSRPTDSAPSSSGFVIDKIKALEERAAKRRERIVTPADAEYPRQLFDLPQPPAALFVAGQKSLQVSNQIAIVGSRLATPYGMSQAAILARGLAERGLTITSGLARGIDAQAHRGALKGGGHTIAVIGCGLDIYYPRENARLQRHIAAVGNVISEYAYGTQPNAWHFPARNRIIAALAMGTIIVQASNHSGALITANIANDLGREVMAVPGALDVLQSGGCLQLILDGANPVRHVRDVFDVLQVFEPASSAAENAPAISPSASIILKNLTAEGSTVNELVEKCRLAPGLTASALNQLNIAGHVQCLPEGIWIPT
ncbi:DNA-processing protein DprA [bacterium]|nr:DNA-processing protein DprA [bacterium]